MARRGSGLHLTKEGRKKLNFTSKLKKKQDEKTYQKNQNKLRNNESSNNKTSNKKSKPVNKVQERFKKRVSEGKSGFTGGPKGETVAEYRARQEKKIKEAARKRHEAFKAKRKLKIKNK